MAKLTLLLLAVAAPLLVTCQMTDTLRKQVLDGHNEMRRKLVQSSNMIEMEYDATLEKVAQDYINTQSSNFKHNADRTKQFAALGGSGYVGENWYSGSPSDAAQKWTEFVWPKAWGMNGCSEQQNYWATYEASTKKGKKYSACKGGTVGHYTQVMWATSVKVGCGYSKTAGTVCEYAPGGNVNGYTGYMKAGKACSACPQGFQKCNNGLCLADGSSPRPAPPPPTPSPTHPSSGSCADKNAVCPGWVKGGYDCKRTTVTYNGAKMTLDEFCPKSCDACPTGLSAVQVPVTTAMYAMDDGPGGVGPTLEARTGSNNSLAMGGMMILVVGGLGLVSWAMRRSAVSPSAASIV